MNKERETRLKPNQDKKNAKQIIRNIGKNKSKSELTINIINKMTAMCSYVSTLTMTISR